MAIADTYDSTKTISEQRSAREAAVIAEDAYYKSAGKIDRPLPDNWPWPVVKEAQQADDTANDALEARVTQAEADIDTNTESIATNTGNISTNTSNISSQGTRLTMAEGKITTLEGKVSTAEGEIDTLQSDVSSLDTRVDALESPAAG